MSLSFLMKELYNQISRHHSNSIAGSDFRPLSNIPYCWPIFQPWFYSLRTLYAQSRRITLAPPVLPRLLARVLAGTTSLTNVIIIVNERTLQLKLAVFIQIVLLDQTFVHCPISPTAGRNFSLDLVSVPVWLIIRKDQLKINGLVSC